MILEQLTILLADDDIDDCDFFKLAINELAPRPSIIIVHDGEQLMQLLKNKTNLQQNILFLDLNMPRKNGFECLDEIKSTESLKQLSVVIFSTSYEQEVVNQLYLKGAHYFIRKPSDFLQFKKIIQQTLSLFANGNSSRPSKEHFVQTIISLTSKHS